MCSMIVHFFVETVISAALSAHEFNNTLNCKLQLMNIGNVWKKRRERGEREEEEEGEREEEEEGERRERGRREED